ncbi:MAG: AAA family ATPase [Candidatus Bathyarchaeia archaeon]
MDTLQRRIPTGCHALDEMLGGGLTLGDVTLVYGEAETGKTSLAIQCGVRTARIGYKAIFVDSDDTFSPVRLSQIAHKDIDEVAPSITLVKPTTFQEQALAIDRLDEYLTKAVGLVVVDTLTSLYRAELGEPKRTFTLNRELGRQVACLAQIAKTRKVAVLVNSQVRNVFLEGVVKTEPVATRVLKFWADVVLNLKHTGQSRVMKAVLEKCPRQKRHVSCYYVIGKTGIRDYGR